MIYDIYNELFAQRNSNGYIKTDSILNYMNTFDIPRKEFVLKVILLVDNEILKEENAKNGKRS